MSDKQAGRWIIVAVIVMGLAAVIDSLAGERRGLPSVRVPIAIFIVAMLLALFREANPEIAGALAVLIIITAALTSGRPVWDALTTVTGGTPAT